MTSSKYMCLMVILLIKNFLNLWFFKCISNTECTVVCIAHMRFIYKADKILCRKPDRRRPLGMRARQNCK